MCTFVKFLPGIHVVSATKNAATSFLSFLETEQVHHLIICAGAALIKINNGCMNTFIQATFWQDG